MRIRNPIWPALALFLAFALLGLFPSPARAEELELPDSRPVTFDGAALPSGAVYLDGIPYVLLSEVADALQVPLDHPEGSDEFGFAWRKDYVSLHSESYFLRYLGKDTILGSETILCRDGSDLLVPLRDFCEGAQIGYLYDEEFDHIYCTPAAGNWEIPRGYTVPVMMYHGVGHGSSDANLFVYPEALERQFQFLLSNGYTPIWFEDLEHVEDYEKPVILTFDDGWKNNYSNLFPLVKKYHVKVTIFAVCSYLDRKGGNHMDKEDALEMAESGYVSFQSHMYDHIDLTDLSPKQQERQMRSSLLYLTRLFGRQPCAMSYPLGGSDYQVEELARQYYHFATKMVRKTPYNTSEDPILIYRFFPEKKTALSTYREWLESSFRYG